MERTISQLEVPPVTVVIPAFNEERAIRGTVEDICGVLSRSGGEYEILVIDDCSTDGTAEELNLLKKTHQSLKVIRHQHNRGYGAALKTGIRAARFNVIAITDADSTYPNERIPELAARLGVKDMVVGARVGKNAKIPLVRRPAKWVIGQLANYLARQKIPDINSGLRVFDKQTLVRYLGVLPDGFSFTTTITLAMLTCNDAVEYVPIDYASRVGKSKIKPIRDTLNFLQLIIRTILLFEPLRIFLPVSAFLFLGAIGVLVYSLFWTTKVMDMTITLLAVGALQMLAIGMIADMINRRIGR